MIKDEIKDAEKYANNAISYRQFDPELAEIFFRLANEELHHVDLLHEQVVRIIKDIRENTGITPPQGMLEIYHYLHEDQISDVRQIRSLLDLYRRN